VSGRGLAPVVDDRHRKLNDAHVRHLRERSQPRRISGAVLKTAPETCV
jgi:hypothetical protein